VRAAIVLHELAVFISFYFILLHLRPQPKVVNVIYQVMMMMMMMMMTYVRPIVEYTSVIWSPHNVDLLKSVEIVQRCFTKRLPGCGQLSYSGRLAKLNLDSLQLRRFKADLTYVYKYFSFFLL